MTATVTTTHQRPFNDPMAVSPASRQPRPGPLGRLARSAFRHRGRTLLLWLAAFVLALGLSTAFGGKFDADYSAPGSDSYAALIHWAQAASHDGLVVAVNGISIINAEAPPIGSEGIGMVAAAIILLLMFGSIVAAGLPILVAAAGLAVSSMITGLIAALLPVPDWSTSLATMSASALASTTHC
jgi:uncharacterized membrane protein YdfJ with MMPL/SSD domain